MRLPAGLGTCISGLGESLRRPQSGGSDSVGNKRMTRGIENLQVSSSEPMIRAVLDLDSPSQLIRCHTCLDGFPLLHTPLKRFLWDRCRSHTCCVGLSHLSLIDHILTAGSGWLSSAMTSINPPPIAPQLSPELLRISDLLFQKGIIHGAHAPVFRPAQLSRSTKSLGAVLAPVKGRRPPAPKRVAWPDVSAETCITTLAGAGLCARPSGHLVRAGVAW